VTRANSVAIGIPPGKTIEEESRPHISGHDPYFVGFLPIFNFMMRFDGGIFFPASSTALAVFGHNRLKFNWKSWPIFLHC
jgi:hypothetical protein